uniref:Uncharacterized protein AlNc14C53G4095 n=1 Tax=Albugo laibachii Nc14 TaxID=890382 RepID=F0WBQ4_9STRA|nr:conserved hypothetical protein [Albugo laibachii Nc14]CCA20538.1 conserved hypothetical protein [Albugo laibachii Nc14]|eukprot:CCA20538.1 conserved hypothetical protein [Albugo laibachii Nc14]
MPFSSVSTQICSKLNKLLADLEKDESVLRIDLLRDLAYHSNVYYLTEKMKNRLRAHCMTKSLIETSLAPLFTHLHVEQYDCHYDDKRNCGTIADIVFDFRSLIHGTKKRKSTHPNKCYVANLSFRYSRQRVLEECESAQIGDTVLTFDVMACLPDAIDSGKHTILHFELVSSREYPESFYQMPNEVDLTDDQEETKKKPAVAEEEPVLNDTDERIVAFELDTSFLEQLVSWNDACLKAKTADGEIEEKEQVANVLQFILALPVYEDEWIIDERIMDLIDDIEANSDSEDQGEDDTGHS